MPIVSAAALWRAECGQSRIIGGIAVGIVELAVIEKVEKLCTELKMLTLSHWENFVHGKVNIVDRRATTNCPLSISDTTKETRIGSHIFRESCGIKPISAIALGFCR